MTTRLAIALIVALLAHPAHTAELGWHSGGDELNAELRYGTADKSETPLSFWCEPARGVVYVAWEFRPANPSEAMDVDFTLSAGGIDLPLGGVGYNVGDTGFVVESQIIYDQKFRDLIASDGNLTATTEGKTETFPLAGAKEKTPVLLEMCERTL